MKPEVIGKVLANSNTNSFRFASTQFFPGKFVSVPTQYDGEPYKVIGEVTKLEVQNSYVEKPSDVRYIGEDDEGVSARSIYVATVSVIGVLLNYNLINFPLPPIPGSNVLIADSSEMKLVLQLPERGVCIGELKDHGFPLRLAYNKLVRTHSSIVGQTGSGKSYLVAKITIELLKARRSSESAGSVPIPIILDSSGEYSGNAELEPEHSAVALVAGSLTAGEQHFPLLNDKFLPVLSDIYDLDSRIETQLSKWLRGSDSAAAKGAGSMSQESLFETAGTVKLAQEFNQLRINSTRHLADKMEEYLLRYNELNPKNQLIVPYKILAKMRRFNLKIKKTEDFDLVEKLGDGLAMDLSKQSDLAERQVVIKLLLTQLMGAARQKKIKSKIIVFIEEAHNYVPSIYKSICKEEILTIAREGRKYGISLCLVSQRPRWVDPTALSQCGNMFIFRIQNSEDQKHIFESASLPDSVRQSNIARLFTGEMIIAGDITEAPIICKVSEIDNNFILSEKRRISKKHIDKVLKPSQSRDL